jgi:hypothetical protein
VVTHEITSIFPFVDVIVGGVPPWKTTGVHVIDLGVPSAVNTSVNAETPDGVFDIVMVLILAFNVTKNTLATAKSNVIVFDDIETVWLTSDKELTPNIFLDQLDIVHLAIKYHWPE